MPADLDLIDFLSADHQNLKEAGGTDAFVEEVVKHLTAERALLYPAVERFLADGRGRVADMRVIDDQLEDSSTDKDAARALVAHIDSQEALFSRLRAEVPSETLVELGRQVPLVVSEAPSRLHPHAPEGGPLRELISELDAVKDQIRDRLEKRRS
jgi:hypothetical protein